MYLSELDAILIVSFDFKADHSREASLHLSLGYLMTGVGGQTGIAHTLNL